MGFGRPSHCLATSLLTIAGAACGCVVDMGVKGGERDKTKGKFQNRKCATVSKESKQTTSSITLRRRAGNGSMGHISWVMGHISDGSVGLGSIPVACCAPSR